MQRSRNLEWESHSISPIYLTSSIYHRECHAEPLILLFKMELNWLLFRSARWESYPVLLTLSLSCRRTYKSGCTFWVFASVLILSVGPLRGWSWNSLSRSQKQACRISAMKSSLSCGHETPELCFDLIWRWHKSASDVQTKSHQTVKGWQSPKFNWQEPLLFVKVKKTNHFSVGLCCFGCALNWEKSAANFQLGIVLPSLASIQLKMQNNLEIWWKFSFYRLHCNYH